MSAVTTQFTLADLERMAEDGMHREILHGELIEMPPPKPRHAIITSRNSRIPGVVQSSSPFGSGVRVEDGYKIFHDERTWLEPDISFLVHGRLPADPDKDCVEGAPDLAVEVIPLPRPRKTWKGRSMRTCLGGGRAQ